MKKQQRSKKETKYFYFFCKRTIDIILSFIGIVIFLIVALIVKICYMLTGDFKSIIYVHERGGKNNKLFKMYKFRTMVHN